MSVGWVNAILDPIELAQIYEWYIKIIKKAYK